MEEKRRMEGEHGSRRGISGKKRNERNAAFIKLCADVCAPFHLFFFDFIRLCSLRFPFPRSTYIYMCVHPLHPFSTPPRAKITIPLLTPPSLVLLFSFSPIPNSNFSPLERGGIILFSKKLLENECQREREGKRGETLSNRGLFPSLPLKLCFRTDPNRKRERERVCLRKDRQSFPKPVSNRGKRFVLRSKLGV